MPRRKEFLLEQIARARRFVAAMNSAADRERFDKMAAGLESELEGAEGAESQSSVARTHRKTRSKRMELPKCSPRLQTRMIRGRRSGGADGLACWAVQSPMLKLIGTLHDDQGRSG